MSKFLHDFVLDAALERLRDSSTRLIACQGQPTTYTEATTPVAGGKYLGESAALDAGDFTLGNDPTSGRALTLLTQALQVNYAGSCDHFALVCDTAGSERLLWATPVVNVQQVYAGNSITSQDCLITIQDAV